MCELKPSEGASERANRTLQDRLVKDLRLTGICDMSAGNEFLPTFIERFNEKFALPAAKAENLHRTLNLQASRLADILCHREQRHVSQQLSLAYNRSQIILDRSELDDSWRVNMSRSTTSPTGRSRCAGKPLASLSGLQ